jgi:hypothetical protein
LLRFFVPEDPRPNKQTGFTLPVVNDRRLRVRVRLRLCLRTVANVMRLTTFPERLKPVSQSENNYFFRRIRCIFFKAGEPSKGRGCSQYMGLTFFKHWSHWRLNTFHRPTSAHMFCLERAGQFNACCPWLRRVVRCTICMEVVIRELLFYFLALHN